MVGRWLSDRRRTRSSSRAASPTRSTFWQQAIVIDQTNPTPRLRKAQALIALGRDAEGDALLHEIATTGSGTTCGAASSTRRGAARARRSSASRTRSLVRSPVADAGSSSSRSTSKFLWSRGLEPYPVQEQAISADLRRQERARHGADRHRQDADGEGRAARRARPRPARDLHHAAARADRGEVPRAVRRLRRGQRRVRDRRLQGQPRGADPGRGRRDPVEPDRRRQARVARPRSS